MSRSCSTGRRPKHVTGVTKNPLRDGFKYKKPEKPNRDKPRGFRAEEERVILAAALTETKPLWRWSPFVQRHTGVRLEELVGAAARDVTTMRCPVGNGWEDVPVLHVRLDHRDRSSIKNIGSERMVPLHPDIAEGFLAYARSVPQDGPLFPNLPIDKYGKRSHAATKSMSYWIKRLGLTDPRIEPTHSWRHRFKTLCRGVMDEEAHDALTGHKGESVGRD
jgi:integrase